MNDIIYTIKDEKASKYLPKTFIDHNSDPLRTHCGIMIGYTEEDIDFPNQSNFAEIMADPEIEKIHSKTTVFRSDDKELISRTYHFILYCNYDHPYFKEPVLQSIPENSDYECTIIFSYVDDSCGDEPVFIHLPLVINATESIDDIIAEIGRYEYADIKDGILKDYWKKIIDSSFTKDDNEDNDEEEDEIEEQGIPFFTKTGEKFLGRELNPKNLVAFKIVEIKQKSAEQMTEKNDETIIN